MMVVPKENILPFAAYIVMALLLAFVTRDDSEFKANAILRYIFHAIMLGIAYGVERYSGQGITAIKIGTAIMAISAVLLLMIKCLIHTKID